MTVETSRADIAPIQTMRAIAALLVVMVHVDQQLAAMGRTPLGMGWGARGVDVFFVISGFIMWVSIERHPGISAGAFLRRRLERIVPLYWTITGLVVAVAIIAPDLVQTARFDPTHTIASFLFIPAPHPANGSFWPVVVPGWSLNFEMLFYVLFALAIAVAGGSPKARFAWLAGLIVGASVLTAVLSPAVPLLAFYNPWLLTEFLSGVMLAIAYNSARVPVGRTWLLALPFGLALLWQFWASDPIALIGATLLVAGALFAPLPSLRPLERLGDASYSLYLTQVLSLPAAGLAWRGAGLAGAPEPLFAAFALTIATVTAFTCYYLFERPVDRRLRRLHLAEHRAQVGTPVGRG